MNCLNCGHARLHNRWGRCAEDGCSCVDLELDPASEIPFDDDPDPEPDPLPLTPTVQVMRQPGTERPIAVPVEVVRAADRVYNAYLEKAGGLSWEQVAVNGGWPSPAAAAAEVKRYLDDGRAVWQDFQRTEAQALLLTALDQLQAAVWSQALAGKVNHVLAARRIVADKIKLLGFDKPTDDPTGGATPTTVVITSAHFADDLRRAAELSNPQPVIGPPQPEPDEP